MKKILLFIKRIINLYKSVIQLFNNWYYKVYFSAFYNNVHWGSEIKIFGKFLHSINKSSKVIFGDNIIFRSKTEFNFIGIYKPVSISVGKNALLSIGDFSGFSGTSIVVTQEIVIGKYCNFGGNTAIWDTDFHPLNFNDRRVHNLTQILSSPIKIGDDVFVGGNTIILKGVTIGDRSVIGAGSVVTKDIPNDEVWAGNPAKFIRKI